ncbi:MAG: zinc ribbon domain-containing protein [Firmicutes bacterium]|nr:zinc ribbon domain-containing protein [Bacillota bacterium]
MKICRKCKKEYKDDYIYCPKCGTPYDEKMKAVRTPGDIGGLASKIWNGFLYGVGGLLILVYLSSFTEDIVSSIFAILFGLSLFKVFYTLIEDKFSQIDEKYIKIARIVLPILILFVWIICTPVENVETEDNGSQSNVVDKEENVPIKDDSVDNETSSDESEKEAIKEEPKETVYTIKYNEIGEYGKYMEFEKKNVIFYYLPDGKYKVEATNMNENICFLWIDYREGYQNGNYGTAYNSKEMLKFTTTSKNNTVSIDSSVHIYNSNNCDYKFTLIN